MDLPLRSWCRQVRVLEDGLHGRANGVVVPIERSGFCAPREVRRSCAAANKGLIALFLRTTSATIAFSPLDVD